ncbi:MAG: RNA-binding protein Hfq [Paenibacillus sp.]|uniref:RNA chaperone Hfq n=1 Tax=Paenibacillus sp. GCM10012303 TaxID=3317340 RepID=UPI0029EC53BD|nr:RNA-binding protein Hfq [Paenibacillus sp.]
MIEELAPTKAELIQDRRLNTLRKNRAICTIIIMNGARIKGTIDAFDKFVVLIRESKSKQYLIYKHAISTIVTETAVEFDS